MAVKHSNQWLKTRKGAQLHLPLSHGRKPAAHTVKKNLLRGAKARSREKGIEFSVGLSDLAWPSNCPVLGIELDYSPVGSRSSNNPGNPSLDRWDNTKGYVPGNVFVISMRANSLKSNASWQEIEAVMRYTRDGLRPFLRVVA